MNVLYLRKPFRDCFYAKRDIKEVDEFLNTYFVMITKLNEFFTDSEDFREQFRDIMEGQFEHDFYNKRFSNQVICYGNDTLDNRIEFWLLRVHRGEPIPDKVNIYHKDEKFN